MAEPKWNPGMFVWRELLSDDLERARTFYADLFGWKWKGENMGPGGMYWLATSGDRQVGGAFQKPPGMPGPNTWSSYALVDDVDAAARRGQEAGGKVAKEPADIPNVGRFAVLFDPWGAMFQLFKSSVQEPPPPAEMPPAGSFCWETLVTPDVSKAVAYYQKVIGFGTAKTPNGEGVMFTAGEIPVADLQPARPGMPTYWATYVRVEQAEASRDKAARLGGRVIVPRIDVPKVGIVSVIADPTGASLGLFEPGR
jgi:predicted enzyme related to lactoylglutathione lyase